MQSTWKLHAKVFPEASSKPPCKFWEKRILSQSS